jgi:membrane-associated phospholipid phosphatase
MRLVQAIDVELGRRAAAGWAVVLLLVFAVLAVWVNARGLAITDSLLLTIAQTPSGPPLDVVMVGLSLLGSVEVAGAVMLVLVARLVVLRGRLSLSLLVPVGLLLAATVVEVAGKLLVHQPSPPASLMRGPRVGFGVATAYSFPSGHMVRATFVYGLVALRAMRKYPSLWWPWVCVLVVWTIGYSRVYLANHWPADVAGGILLGGAALALTLALAPRASLGEDLPT